jgi:hypothetical protein
LLINARIQTAVVGQFHDQIGLPVVFVESVNVDDVGVIQSRTRAGFTIEILHRQLVIHHLLFDQFHRDHALEHGVESAIHGTVAAGRDNTAQFELPQRHGHHDGMPAFGTGNSG